MPQRPLISRRQVETFRAVMLLGSLTQAAEFLRTSQPTVSRVLKDLSIAIGFPLFYRQGRRILPTREGLALFKEVELNYQGLERIEQAAAVIRRTGGERLRIAAVTSVSLGLLPIALQGFRKHFRDVGIIVEAGRSESVLARVLSRQCDIGFALVPTNLAEVSAEPFADANAVCVLPSDHPLASRAWVNPDDIATPALIVVGQPLPGRPQIDQLFSSRDSRSEPMLEVQSGAIACAMVAHGLGVAVLDALTVRALNDPRVVVRPLKPTVVYRYSALVVRSESGGRMVRALIDAVRHAVGGFCESSTEIKVLEPAEKRVPRRLKQDAG